MVFKNVCVLLGFYVMLLKQNKFKKVCNSFSSLMNDHDQHSLIMKFQIQFWIHSVYEFHKIIAWNSPTLNLWSRFHYYLDFKDEEIRTTGKFNCIGRGGLLGADPALMCHGYKYINYVKACIQIQTMGGYRWAPKLSSIFHQWS